MQQIDIETWTKEHNKRMKREERKRKLNQFKDEVFGMAREHPEMALTVAAGVVTGIFALGRGVVKNINLHKQEHIKNDYCYDRSLGHYWKLRRELTNAEWLEIDKRKKNGERLSDILSELKVLK